MGHDAVRLAGLHGARALGCDSARRCHPGHGAGLQSDGRRSARRPRSEAEALMALVEIKNLSVEFSTARGVLRAVDQLDLTINEGEVVGVVGESGSGKSVTMLALMGLIPWPGKVTAERLTFDGQDLIAMP